MFDEIDLQNKNEQPPCGLPEVMLFSFTPDVPKVL